MRKSSAKIVRRDIYEKLYNIKVNSFMKADIYGKIFYDYVDKNIKELFDHIELITSIKEQGVGLSYDKIYCILYGGQMFFYENTKDLEKFDDIFEEIDYLKKCNNKEEILHFLRSEFISHFVDIYDNPENMYFLILNEKDLEMIKRSSISKIEKGIYELQEICKKLDQSNIVKKIKDKMTKEEIDYLLRNQEEINYLLRNQGEFK